MDCIICQDNGSEPLQNNTHCQCNYKYHTSCWIDYVNSKNKLNCPMCRKDISHNYSIILVNTPYTLSNQQITYQEFVNTIQQHISNQPTVIEMHQPLHNKPYNIMNIILGCFILIIIVIIFIVCIRVI